jgi:hypothetical protein
LWCCKPATDDDGAATAEAPTVEAAMAVAEAAEAATVTTKAGISAATATVQPVTGERLSTTLLRLRVVLPVTDGDAPGGERRCYQQQVSVLPAARGDATSSGW